MTNRLADEMSPYLLLHADNPVDWWPWGPEAFGEARRRGVPVLLSVGYAACHWCHVMNRESFQDAEVAAFLNEQFVAVKVDREERPDVDAVYMEAVQAATGQGGWPMTVFLTPEGEPFRCGTYYPPRPRHGLPSFRQVLAGVALEWRERRGAVDARTRELAARLARPEGVFDATTRVPPPDEAQAAAAVRVLGRQFDREYGGFGGEGTGPKFPPSMVLEFLLRHHASGGPEADAALEMAGATFEAMARGGIHDQLGGGFARYAVDGAWAVPHFEKMLYDNALLLRGYLHWWRATGAPLGRRAAERAADFLLRELRTPEGGFASSLDADSRDPDDPAGASREGAYYVWTPAQLAEALGADDADRAGELFGVGGAGAFEHGSSVLQLPEDPADAAWFAGVVSRLLEVRGRRPRPARDDKVVAAWNGLAVAALAEAGVLLDRPEFTAAARDAADLLLRVHRTDTAPGGSGALGGVRLRRTSRDGVAGESAGVLEDYADTAEGLIALHAATGEPRWLTAAGELLDTVLAQFADPASGALHDTAADAERLIRRPQDPADNATPSGWNAAAAALLSYAALTGSERHREAAERALGVVGALAARSPLAVGWGLAAAEALRDGPCEVALAGEDLTPDGRPGPLRAAALRGTAPGTVIALAGPDQPARDGLPTAYVCRGFVCGPPLTDPAALAAALGAREADAREAGAGGGSH